MRGICLDASAAIVPESRPPLKYDPFLSGSRLLTTQTFRNLFRCQVIEATEGIGVRDLTLLFTDLKGSTSSMTASAISTPTRRCSATSSGSST